MQGFLDPKDQSQIFLFQIEYGGPSCIYDYVEIRDGGDETAMSLKKVCGGTLPNTIKSTGNKMFVKFHSDDSVVKKGFSASFKEVKKGKK